MKKIAILIIFIMYSNLILVSQNTSFNKKILNLKLSKRNSVTVDNYKKGKFIFEETLKKDFKDFNYANYWNLSIALSYLGENDNLIQFSIKKAYEIDSLSVYNMLKHIEGVDNERYKELLIEFSSIKEKILNFDEKKSLSDFDKNNTFNINSYCDKNKLDRSLVKLMRSISKDDQKYRGQDYKKKLIKQRELDILNLQTIDSLYNKHGAYIGKSLVGEKFSHVMWLVIQHSNIEKMEEYLPVLIEAVKKKELKLNPLKMLIDRIYTVRFGYQIFASQMGVDLANEEVRKKVIAKYAIDSLE